MLALTERAGLSKLRGPFRREWSTSPLAARFIALPPACSPRLMKTAIHIGAVLAFALSSGCVLFSSSDGHSHFAHKGRSPLQPAQPSSDSVLMNIVWARFPANDPVLDDAAWHEIDETTIEPAVRKELLNNGLRAGVISGAMPPPIAKIMREDVRPEAPPATGDPTVSAKSEGVDLLTEPVVHGRTCRVRRKQRTEIQASEVYPSLPLLISGGSELGGHTYENAQAVYALRVDPQPDRSALVELTPELQFGQPRLRISGGDQGFVRQESQKERNVFDKLRVSAKLGPGDTLILMSLPDAGSRLGHYFHTVDSAEGPQQKLILIRLAEVPESDTFTAK
jgi:hypothetical protein